MTIIVTLNCLKTITFFVACLKMYFYFVDFLRNGYEVLKSDGFTFSATSDGKVAYSIKIAMFKTDLSIFSAYCSIVHIVRNSTIKFWNKYSEHCQKSGLAFLLLTKKTCIRSRLVSVLVRPIYYKRYRRHWENSILLEFDVEGNNIVLYHRIEINSFRGLNDTLPRGHKT